MRESRFGPNPKRAAIVVKKSCDMLLDNIGHCFKEYPGLVEENANLRLELAALRETAKEVDTFLRSGCFTIEDRMKLQKKLSAELEGE